MREFSGCWVYIVACSDSSYYVGSTRSTPEIREAEHNEGKYPGYTFRRRPVRLVFSEHFQQITDAVDFERQIKGWARIKKEALIERRWDLLPELSKAGLRRR
jgi:putative endonuclease